MQVCFRVEGIAMTLGLIRDFRGAVPDGYTYLYITQTEDMGHTHAFARADCAWHGCCSAVAQRPASRGDGLLGHLRPDRMTLLHGCGFLRALPADAVAAKESR